jgi:hypothetical protein
MNLDQILFAYLDHRDPKSEYLSWWDKPSGVLGLSIDHLNLIAAAVYFLLAVVPLAYMVVKGKLLPSVQDGQDYKRLLIFSYLGLVALLPTMWQWVHASAFFDWVNVRFACDDAAKRIEVEHFNRHAEFAKSLWAGVLALYGASFLSAK